MNVLLLTANRQMQQTLGDALRKRRHEPTVLGDVDAALDACRSTVFSLVLLDTGSPGTDAVGLCRRLRAELSGDAWSILAISENGSLEDPLKLLQAGADDILAYPADPAQLDARLAVAEHRARRLAEASSGGTPLGGAPIESFPVGTDAPFGMFRSTLQGQLLEASPMLARILKYDSVEELLRVDIAKDIYANPAQRQRVLSEDPGDSATFEAEWKCKDGTPVTVRVSGVRRRNEAGETVLLEGIIEDITKEKWAEQALRESEAKLRNLFENMPDVVVMIDRQGNVQYLNHFATEESGEGAIGTRGIDWIAPEHRQRAHEALIRAFETREVQRNEVLGVNGVWWACRLVPLIENDVVSHVMIICTNITEEKKRGEEAQQERELLQQLIDLHERDRQLTAYEIHDGFAQQLTGARFSLEAYARLRGQNPEEAEKALKNGLQMIGQSIDETRRLISGLRPPILDEFGIVAAVDYLICECREHDSVEITFLHDVRFARIAPPLESAIFRIVQESLTNACRHSKSDKIHVELLEKDEQIHIEVRDWGVGFDRDHVNEQHFGLRGIRERARLLGGKAVIETAAGQGTSVTIRLPLVRMTGS